MLKSISAALIAVSMLAAPAMAAGPSRHADKSVAAPLAHAKPGVRDAHARMVRHHHRHVRPHHRFHHKMGMTKTFKHTASKLNPTRATVAHIKRG
jgi:Ni/Co efflux regulator RcnB